MPRYFPAALRLDGRRCVVVGGGSVAARRVEALLEADAHVVVVAPDAVPELQAASRNGHIEWDPGEYRPQVLDGAFLVVAAAGPPEVNAAVAADARARGVLCNDADEPERGDLVVPASVRRGDLLLAVTAGGASPALAGRLRRELAARYGPEYGELVTLLAEARAIASRAIADPSARRGVLKRLANDDTLLDLVRTGRTEEARAEVMSCISSLQD